MSKFQIRKLYTSKRCAIPTKYKQAASIAAPNFLEKQTLFKQSEHIACYLSVKDEFDTSPLIETIWKAKKNCYLPVLPEKDEKKLNFVKYQYGDALHLNRYSILEPVNKKRLIDPHELELVITPLVAFDNQGHRIGTGGGYYDHTFEFVKEAMSNKPVLLGLAYAEQEAENIPADPWDINLSGVITEKGFTFFLGACQD